MNQETNRETHKSNDDMCAQEMLPQPNSQVCMYNSHSPAFYSISSYYEKQGMKTINTTIIDWYNQDIWCVETHLAMAPPAAVQGWFRGLMINNKS